MSDWLSGAQAGMMSTGMTSSTWLIAPPSIPSSVRLVTVPLATSKT